MIANPTAEIFKNMIVILFVLIPIFGMIRATMGFFRGVGEQNVTDEDFSENRQPLGEIMNQFDPFVKRKMMKRISGDDEIKLSVSSSSGNPQR